MEESDGSSAVLGARLSYSYSQFQTLYNGRFEVEDALKRNIQSEIFSLGMFARFAEGISIDAVLPFGVLRTEDIAENSRFAGIGDLTVRLRQDFSRWYSRPHAAIPRISFGVGLVAPTGTGRDPSDSRDQNLQTAIDQQLVGENPGAIPNPQSGGEVFNMYASLGRKSWDVVSDLQLAWEPRPFLTIYSGVRGRMSVFRAFGDQTEWGPEVLTQVGALASFPDAGISLLLGVEHLWRGVTSERIEGQKLDLINSGGHWVSVTPSVAFHPFEDLRFRVATRFPVFQDVNGFQLVSEPSIMFDLIFRWEVGGTDGGANQSSADTDVVEKPRSRPNVVISDGRAFEISEILVPGKINLVDYFAIWCEPCHVLDRNIREAIKDHSGVVLRKVDIVTMDSDASKKHLPDVDVIPVLDIYDGEGKRRVRLVGKDVFTFQDYLSHEHSEDEGQPSEEEPPSAP